MQLRIYAAFVVLLCSYGVRTSAADLTETETRLVRHLLHDYVPTVAPSVPGGVKVEVEITLSTLEASTTLETLEIAGWWRLYWQDPRLAWNASDWGDIAALRFRNQQVWQPDVIIYEQISDSILPVDITISSSGGAFVSLPRKTKFACPMNLASFPFDTQHCKFTIGSWSYDGTKVDVLPRSIDKESRFEDPETAPDRSTIDVTQIQSFQEWILAAVRQAWKNTFYGCCVEPYPVIVVEFELHRATMTYLGGMIAPLIVVTSVGLTTLLMPSPTSGAKPALCVTIMLTTATVYFVASRSTPNSNGTTLIGRMYMVCLSLNLVLVFFSIWTTALNLIHKDNSMSVQHFMDFFYLCDKESSGSLDPKEVDTALKCLQISDQTRTEIINSLCKSQQDPHRMQNVTEQQWLVIGELSHKSQHGAIYHNAAVKEVVINEIIKDLKARRDDGKEQVDLTDSADPILRSLGSQLASISAQAQYHRRASHAHMRRASLLRQRSHSDLMRTADDMSVASSDGEDEEHASWAPRPPPVTADLASQGSSRRLSAPISMGGRSVRSEHPSLGPRKASDLESLEDINFALSPLDQEERLDLASAPPRVQRAGEKSPPVRPPPVRSLPSASRLLSQPPRAQPPRLRRSSQQALLPCSPHAESAAAAGLEPEGQARDPLAEAQGGGGEGGAAARVGGVGRGEARLPDLEVEGAERQQVGAGEQEKQGWVWPKAWLPRRHGDFKKALDQLGAAMDKFAVANSHPPAVGRALSAKVDRGGRRVMPVVFVVYLLVEFTGVLSGPEGVRFSVGYRSPMSGQRRILVEFFDYRSGPEELCYLSYYKEAAVASEFRKRDQCSVR